MKETTIDNKFRNALLVAIRRYVRLCVANGTTGMSLENLMQCVVSPSPTVEGAPMGCNARWAYREMFAALCQEKDIAPFIIVGRMATLA